MAGLITAENSDKEEARSRDDCVPASPMHKFYKIRQKCPSPGKTEPNNPAARVCSEIKPVITGIPGDRQAIDTRDQVPDEKEYPYQGPYAV